jgi:hypothetical protein
MKAAHGNVSRALNLLPSFLRKKGAARTDYCANRTLSRVQDLAPLFLAVSINQQKK